MPQVTDKLYYIMYRVHIAWAGFELTTLLMKGTNYTGKNKSNYHTFMTTTDPVNHSKCMNKIVDHKRQVKFDFGIIIFGVMPLICRKKSKISAQ